MIALLGDFFGLALPSFFGGGERLVAGLDDGGERLAMAAIEFRELLFVLLAAGAELRGEVTARFAQLSAGAGDGFTHEFIEPGVELGQLRVATIY